MTGVTVGIPSTDLLGQVAVVYGATGFVGEAVSRVHRCRGPALPRRPDG